MSEIIDIINKYIYFIFVFFIFLLLIISMFLFANRKGKKRRIYLFGLFMNYNNKQIFALSLMLLNFLLLSYTLILKIPLSKDLICISSLMILISFIILKRYNYVLINGLINIVNISLIYIAHLVNELRLSESTVAYFSLQILMNVFSLFFYIFTTIKFIKNIRGKELNNEQDS